MTSNSPNLEHVRHSFSHLLAAAVLELFPDALPAAGPPTEVGFFYDFSFKAAPTEKDLKRIEKSMRKIVSTWKSFEGKTVSEKEARALFKNNPYKLELIDDIVAKNEDIRLYTSGSFTDLCRGGHVESVSDLKADAFELISVSGAHWKSDESKDMLTRITGIAFASKDDLEAYKTMLEEAKKRDHRKIGKEMNLFTFSELVGPGLPLWTPKGTTIRGALDDFVWELRKARGYERVAIPHITKRGLYETSGHWEKFSDELFRIQTREGHEYALKPMNCPHHTQIFASTHRSYRDMPQRYAETTMVYRDEQSGELAGLSRVLSITQDDAHVFCRPSQIQDEFFAIWDIVDEFYTTLGFSLSVRLSFHNPNEFEKYIGTRETWQEAERVLEELAKKRGATYFVGIGEAAMYGPKIDFMSKDSIGRTWQVATIQLDFNMPKNFGLYCVNEAGEKEDVVMIHAAIMGSLERFTSVMIEHFAGKFPLWIAPVQLVLIPISTTHAPYALKLKEECASFGFRVGVYDENDSLGKRVRKAKLERIPYIAVIGDEEIRNGTLTLESRDTESKVVMSIAELVEKLKREIASRAVRTL
jgi:threonyl-tRNA synthetase